MSTYVVRRTHRYSTLEQTYAVEAVDEDAAIAVVRDYADDGSDARYAARVIGQREVLLLDQATYQGDSFYKGTRQ